MAKHQDDPKHYPPLGRLLHWVDRPGSAMKLVRLLGIVCAIAVLGDLTYEKHGYMAAEHYFGFYAAYGFVMFTGLILVAKALRVLIKRPEDYYAPNAIDAEPYPEEETGKVRHHG